MSDHRALVVDFVPSILFGNDTSDMVPPAQRLLTSTNPRAVHTYIAHLRKHVSIHAIERKVEQLMHASENGTWSSTDETLYEQVSQSMREGRVAAESKLPNKRSGIFWWSPDFDATRQVMFYWLLRAREYTNGIRNEELLAKLEAKIGDVPTNPTMLDDIRPFVHNQNRMARICHDQSKKHSFANRERFDTETAEFDAARRGTSLPNALAAIKQRETAARNKTQMAPVYHEAKSSGVDRIDVPNEYAVPRPNEPTPRIPLVRKEEIEEVLVPHTMKRFRQPKADKTPFADGERSRRLGRNCDSQDASNILNGMYDWKLDELTEEARKWVLLLKRHPNVLSGQRHRYQHQHRGMDPRMVQNEREHCLSTRGAFWPLQNGRRCRPSPI